MINKNVDIYENETIDDLNLKNLKIIQKNGDFKFGVDSILLANFSKIKSGMIGADLGTGSGIISVIILGKSEAKKIYAVEVQTEVAERTSRTIMLNKLQERCEVIHSNWMNLDQHIKASSLDFIVSNPPFMREGSLNSPNENQKISRVEVQGDIDSLFKISEYMLKDKANFFMVHRPNRLCDIFSVCRKYNMEPKEIRFVHPYANKAPNMVLIRFSKKGGFDLKILEPLVMYEDKGVYSKEINKIYSSAKLMEE